MTVLSDLKQLLALRNKRREDAETAILMAQKKLKEEQDALQLAQDELTTYSEKLPKMVDDLYLSIINLEVERDDVQEVRHKELKLYEKKTQLANQVQDAEKAVVTAEEALKQARVKWRELMRQEMALEEVRDEMDDDISRDMGALENRRMDEIAGLLRKRV